MRINYYDDEDYGFLDDEDYYGENNEDYYDYLNRIEWEKYNINNFMGYHPSEDDPPKSVM